MQRLHPVVGLRLAASAEMLGEKLLGLGLESHAVLGALEPVTLVLEHQVGVGDATVLHGGHDLL